MRRSLIVPSATARAPRSTLSLRSVVSVNAAPTKRAPYGSAAATAGAASARTEAAARTHHPLLPSKSQAPTFMLSPSRGGLDGSVPKLRVQDLADEAVDRDRVEAHVGGDDHPRVDDLALRQLLEHPLELAVRVPVVAPNPQLFALERDLRGVAEAEHAGDKPPVHQLALVEDLAVRRPGAAGADHEARRDLDAPADFDRAARLLVLGPDQDVREHVVAGNDPRQRLPHHPGLVEDVAEELEILPLLAHAM